MSRSHDVAFIEDWTSAKFGILKKKCEEFEIFVTMILETMPFFAKKVMHIEIFCNHWKNSFNF